MRRLRAVVRRSLGGPLQRVPLGRALGPDPPEEHAGQPEGEQQERGGLEQNDRSHERILHLRACIAQGTTIPNLLRDFVK